ncbi:MAG TPA: hypothetical protein DIV36_12475, partial [Verrucomicrobiales bacterium]|nr:hypothetical protein [Verrucomicrobiales bacterium]
MFCLKNPSLQWRSTLPERKGAKCLSNFCTSKVADKSEGLRDPERSSITLFIPMSWQRKFSDWRKKNLGAGSGSEVFDGMSLAKSQDFFA